MKDRLRKDLGYNLQNTINFFITVDEALKHIYPSHVWCTLIAWFGTTYELTYTSQRNNLASPRTEAHSFYVTKSINFLQALFDENHEHLAKLVC